MWYLWSSLETLFNIILKCPKYCVTNATLKHFLMLTKENMFMCYCHIRIIKQSKNCTLSQSLLITNTDKIEMLWKVCLYDVLNYRLNIHIIINTHLITDWKVDWKSESVSWSLGLYYSVSNEQCLTTNTLPFKTILRHLI